MSRLSAINRHCRRFSCLVVLFAGAMAARGAMVRDPYLQLVTPNSIIIMWRTNLASPADSRVQYGTALGTLNQTATSVATIPASNPNVRDHVVTITDLAPSTQYYYNVGTTSGGVEAGGTGDYYFTTAPSIGSTSPFNVWFVGDGGNNSANQTAVRDAMLATAGTNPPELFLQLGDIAYESGTDAEFTNNHFAPYANVLRNTVCYPTLGNHEAVNTQSGACWPLPCAPGTTSGPYYEGHVLPTQGEAGGEPSGTEAYYSFDYGNVHFIVLNSEQVNRSAAGPMAQWLEADLQGTAQDWVIAFFHHPPYSRGTHNSDSAADSGGRMVDMRELILPILEAGGVDLVLTGHSHNYERSYLIDGAYGYGTSPNFVTPSFATLDADGHIVDAGDGDPAGDGAYVKRAGLNAHDGTVYVVAGHGGRSVGGTFGHPVMYYSEAAFGSCLMDVEGNTVRVRNIRSDGTITDTFTIIKGQCDDLETGYTLGQMIGTHPDWFDGGAGPVVASGMGVGGTIGLQPAANIFTWIAKPFDWTVADFAGVAIQMDLETDAAGVLDDDRVGWMITDNDVDSDFIFGVQVDPGGGADDGAPAGTLRLEGYWDAQINVTEDRRPEIDILTGTLTPNTFYRLRAEFIKLTATSARIEASLIEIDGAGNPMPGAPVLSGIIADTSALGADAPDPAYFTGPIWPAFKNFTAAGANADNPCVEVLAQSSNTTVTSFQQGQSGYTGTVDTFLDSQNPGTSNAATTPLQVDLSPLRHILLRFDNIFGNGPGQIPPAANIISASLTLNVTNESVGVGAGLYRMLQPWNATDTWNTWGSGIQNNGVEALATADVSGSSAVGPFVLDVTTSLAAWHANPATNHGWAWLPPAQDNSWQFDSAEGTTPPRLTVTYELVCEDNADCDDGNLCTIDDCTVGSCSNDPVVCPLGQVCNPATGACGASSTRTFQEGAGGYTGTQDTTFQESAPGNVNGALDNWEWDDDDPNGAPVQRNFGLLRFDNIVGSDPGQIPPGSQVISATLTLAVFDPGAPASVREMLVDWDEADSLTSACGASCDQGVDFSAVEIAQAPADPVGTYNIDVTASLQTWIDNPVSNRGWFFLPPTGGPTSGGSQVRASEYLAVPADRPKLTVEVQLSCTDDGDCDDGNPCTTDTCGAEDTCEYSNNTEACDDANLCTEGDVCAGGACAGTPVDCPQGTTCNPESGDCVATPLIIAYNDLNSSAGDANAVNVTEHPYTAVNAPLVDYPTGAVTSITMTGATVGGFDPQSGNGGQANAGTDAGITFGPTGAVIVDLNNMVELDATNWDAIYTFNNLDPGRVYTLTTTANRNNPDYAGARFTRVTIEGADTFANTSSPGVVVHGPDSVSFSTGYNTVTGYVARWANITAADGSFSIKSEWNNSLGSGAQNTKGYAMTAFKLQETSLLCDVPSECDDGLFCTGIEDCVSGVCVSSGNPCADPTPICSEANDACVTTCEEILLDNNFDGLVVGANPPNWVDTGANNSLVPNDTLFNVKQVGTDLVFGTDSTATNIHSHYVTPASANWSTFDFTGRMRISVATGAIGVTVLSDYTNSDTYYRLRRLGSGQTEFHLDQHPDSSTTLLGDVTTGVVPAANTWMRFHIQVEVLPLQTNVRANVWADGGGEPAGWQANASDTSPTRLTSGKIGVWSFSTGSKYWDDMRVVFTAGDGAPCDDGDPCTTGDVCADGGCAGTFADCDGDGTCDADDNCPTLANVGQTDSDGDGHGDVCDGPFDADHDGDVDLADHNALADCLAGPDTTPAASELTAPACLNAFDADADGDVDLLDFANFVVAFTGHIATPCD